MKKIKLLTFFIISSLFFILIPQITFSESGRRTALVIGNGGYKFAALRNPVNDATDMASALKNLGFKVTLKTNANQKTMERAIRSFGKTLQKGGVGLFYYAGHGIQINGRNYLIPIGAVIETESDAEFEAVDASRVLGKMEDAKNKINILILDACRNNPYGSQFRSVKRGLAIIPAPQGTIVAYATAPGDIANDGEGRNGLYTSMLLKHISVPDLTIERFFKVVGRDVRSASNNNQIPWIQSSLVDDFFFRKTSVASKLPEKGRLFVDTDPSNARVKILDRDISFYQGIELESDSYQVEVSADDYETKMFWVMLDPGVDKNMSIRLERIADTAPQKLESKSTRYVTDYLKLTLREGPSFEKKIIRMLKSGELLQVLEESEDYSKVKSADGKEGWTLNRFLIEIPTNKHTKFACVTDNLNITLREGPDIQKKVIAVLKSREKLQVLETRATWSRVMQVEGKEGWVMNRFLIELPPDRWCVEGNCSDGDGTFLSAVTRYTGEFKDGMKHGKGTMIFKNGTKYVGEFRNGMMHGQGILTYADGRTERVVYQKGKKFNFNKK